MRACYCGSSLAFNFCCQPVIKSIKKAETAEQLMRSRYTAFVIHDISYIQKTVAGDAAVMFSFDDALSWSHAVDWEELQVLRHQLLSQQRAYVCFKVFMRENGVGLCLYEKSEFKLIQGLWYYTGALSHCVDAKAYRDKKQVTKNDLCPCQSGRRFKHCCW